MAWYTRYGYSVRLLLRTSKNLLNSEKSSYVTDYSFFVVKAPPIFHFRKALFLINRHQFWKANQSRKKCLEILGLGGFRLSILVFNFQTSSLRVHICIYAYVTFLVVGSLLRFSSYIVALVLLVCYKIKKIIKIICYCNNKMLVLLYRHKGGAKNEIKWCVIK